MRARQLDSCTRRSVRAVRSANVPLMSTAGRLGPAASLHSITEPSGQSPRRAPAATHARPSTVPELDTEAPHNNGPHNGPNARSMAKGRDDEGDSVNRWTGKTPFMVRPAWNLIELDALTLGWSLVASDSRRRTPRSGCRPFGSTGHTWRTSTILSSCGLPSGLANCARRAGRTRHPNGSRLVCR